jgi:hypothetical protein
MRLNDIKQKHTCRSSRDSFTCSMQEPSTMESQKRLSISSPPSLLVVWSSIRLASDLEMNHARDIMYLTHHTQTNTHTHRSR